MILPATPAPTVQDVPATHIVFNEREIMIMMVMIVNLMMMMMMTGKHTNTMIYPLLRNFYQIRKQLKIWAAPPPNPI